MLRLAREVQSPTTSWTFDQVMAASPIASILTGVADGDDDDDDADDVAVDHDCCDCAGRDAACVVDVGGGRDCGDGGGLGDECDDHGDDDDGDGEQDEDKVTVVYIALVEVIVISIIIITIMIIRRTTSFVEGPSFSSSSRLGCVDIDHGRCL